ncbi:hypothetical protein BT96DRAFT_914708 [Gymnopus androsaceus JB14]|uniref:Uncharacterized protein n=1 Tax=Gymnopus androsaceus JB14 TaxID=1447944 RepID=A0A6A4I9Y5_9AGAR|nr:hypothetical protein BT96DRAFT_914708 [Gymnopus androsaceus JB14]
MYPVYGSPTLVFQVQSFIDTHVDCDPSHPKAFLLLTFPTPTSLTKMQGSSELLGVFLLVVMIMIIMTLARGIRFWRVSFR